MSHPKTSQQRANAISTASFLIGLAIVSFTQTWWPGSILVVGIPLAIRQYFYGKRYDTGITLFVFVGSFIIASFDISWEILLPVLFFTAGLYILIREWFNPYQSTIAEDEESLSHKIEEDHL